MNKQKIMSLVKASITLVNNFNSSLALQTQCQNHKLFDHMRITDKDLNIFPPMNKKAIGIRNIFENPNLRLTVYYLDQGTTMKLHDHNQLHVISKVLRGKLEAKLYKVLNKKQQLYEKTVKVFDAGSIFVIDGNKTFNLHEFKAIESTFFLDIIFPDYHQDNQCSFYIQKKAISQTEVLLQKTDYDQILFEDI